MSDERAMTHHVLFWLRQPGSEVDRRSLIEGLNAQRSIAVLRTCKIGAPAPTFKRDVVDNSYDVSALLTFKTVADHDLYQAHPQHQRFVDTCAHLWSKVLVLDVVHEPDV